MFPQRRMTTDTPDGNYSQALNLFVRGEDGWVQMPSRSISLNDYMKQLIKAHNADIDTEGTPEEFDMTLCEHLFDGPEAIECCIDHIQDAPAVSQQELRSYMLPWFSPFAAPWCGKIQRAFPKAYVTMNFELILVPRTNTYINLNHCSTPDEFKAEVIEGVSRFAFKAFTKPLCKEHLDGINKLLDTKFTPEDMEYIYTNLGNGINHELCMKFVKSGYDLKVIEESV